MPRKGSPKRYELSSSELKKRREYHARYERERRRRHAIDSRIKYAINNARSAYRLYGFDVRQVFDAIGYPDEGAAPHLDHIIPLSAFDQSDPRQVVAAYHPSNLRWSDPEHNMIKRSAHCPEEVRDFKTWRGVEGEDVINSREKGKRWERLWAQKLSEVYGEDGVERSNQYVEEHGRNDVHTYELACECKVGARINLMAALEQCERDAERRGTNRGRYCIVAAKYDRKRPIVVLRAEDFLEIMKTRRELAGFSMGGGGEGGLLEDENGPGGGGRRGKPDSVRGRDG